MKRGLHGDDHDEPILVCFMEVLLVNHHHHHHHYKQQQNTIINTACYYTRSLASRFKVVDHHHQNNITIPLQDTLEASESSQWTLLHISPF